MRRLLTTLALVPLAAGLADESKKPAPKLNALAQELSPYLRQHAKNPVNWMPWKPETLALAKKQNKLIFLSVGYSACHWCHVMEREAFSDLGIAKTLNEHFICIKVDREERPDVDEVYLSALQASGERGGWPMSIFLMPDAKPIFGGTYFPVEDRLVQGETMPGFKSVLKKVLELVENDRAGLTKQAEQLADLTRDRLERNFRLVPLNPLTRDVVADAALDFEFDPEWGGFGRKAAGYRGSKFPRATALQFLLEQSSKPGQQKLAENIWRTLDQLAAGGIYDHLGGGFHRYSTERTWTVPHFEKMLYDNAQMVELYTSAYQQKQRFQDRRVLHETLGFIQREMTSPNGLFYSALDADTDHEEGKFYVWTAEELNQLGTTPDAIKFKDRMSLNQPNFEGKLHILRLSKPWLELVQEPKTTDLSLSRELEPFKQKLLELRSKRERPFCDTKILTGWNGLMIGAHAKAGQVLQEPLYVTQAERSARNLLKLMRDDNGRLYRLAGGLPGQPIKATGMGYLEDYAYVVHGLLNLHDATNNPYWFKQARELTDMMLKWFGDEDRGGLYMTPHDGEKLFVRSKDYYDGAYPSGNGMAARNLARLWAKTEHKPYAVACERILKQFLAVLKNNGSAAPSLAMAADLLLPR